MDTLEMMVSQVKALAAIPRVTEALLGEATPEEVARRPPPREAFVILADDIELAVKYFHHMDEFRLLWSVTSDPETFDPADGETFRSAYTTWLAMVDAYLRLREIFSTFGDPIGSLSDLLITRQLAAKALAEWKDPPVPALKERFTALSGRWRKETGHLSNPAAGRKPPAYQAILRLGQGAVPLMLADMRDNKGDWFAALGEITGVSPVPKESRPLKTIEARASWVEWGRSEGLL